MTRMVRIKCEWCGEVHEETAAHGCSAPINLPEEWYCLVFWGLGHAFSGDICPGCAAAVKKVQKERQLSSANEHPHAQSQP